MTLNRLVYIWFNFIFLLNFYVLETIQAHFHIHVVAIQKKLMDNDIELCPTLCSGTLLTQTVVLTAATCTEIVPKNYEILEDKKISSRITDGNSTGNSSDTSDKNVTKPYPENKPTGKFNEGDIKVYAKFPMKIPLKKIKYVNVSEKFLHPEWNPKNLVANFVLLKLNKRFFLLGELPNMMNNNMNLLPKKLIFRGLGRKLSTQTESMYYALGDYYETRYDEITNSYNREFKDIEFHLDQCPNSSNNKTEKKDINWWSFLCLKIDRSNNNPRGQTTLCNRDVGGPLYELTGNDGVPKLYGIFSHRYHPTYPICAIAVCYLAADKVYPCMRDDRMFYKFTAIIGRYAFWLNRTIERMEQKTTVTETRHCLIPTVSMKPSITTNDPYYDVDEYDNHDRVMVSNKRVCKTWRQSLPTSSGRAALRRRGRMTDAAVFAVAFGVVDLLVARQLAIVLGVV